MNLEYREGTIVLWVDAFEFRPARDGDHVIVYAYRVDGGVEATVKELRVIGNKRWLIPKSDRPEHQAPIDCDNPGDDISSIEIQGIVIGDYRQRIV